MSVAAVSQGHWAEGPVLEDDVLVEEVAVLAIAATTLAGEDDEAGVEPPLDVQTASVMLDAAAMQLVDVLERSAVGSSHADAAALLVRVNTATSLVREEGMQWRVRAFAHVHAALGRLRGAATIRQLMAHAPAELCKCGFDRVMLSRVEESFAVPEAFHAVGEPAAAAEILRVGRANPIKLDHHTLETEMVRRRGPMLVLDAQNDPRAHRPLIEATGSRCYVAAPVMPQGRVIGFIHADCHLQRRVVDEFDRDLLWTFAEGFGYAYERTVLLERLRSLRQEVRRGHSSILAVMDDFCEADVEVAHVDRGDGSVARSAASMFVSTDSRMESLLTRRELDVIRLMATGETNAGIAVKLVVSEGTVKSHVKHILRKLRASNRAEAVSRFIRLSQQGSRG